MTAGDWPPGTRLRRLAARAVEAAVAAIDTELPAASGEVSIVFTDDAAMRRLNFRYRGKDKATNVLSFPQAGGRLLGDVILAAETVRREAALADKRLEDHMAHLIIHGFLHLLGYDHEDAAEAEKMEQLERVALKYMGISDPYATPKPR